MPPAKWKSVEELQAGIDSYFAKLEGTDEIADVEGLCVHLDTTRTILMRWEANAEEGYRSAINKAKTKIFYLQKQLALRSKLNPAVFIFNSKNNHGYVDRVELDQNLHTDGFEIVFNMPQISTKKIPQLEKLNTIEGEISGNTDEEPS